MALKDFKDLSGTNFFEEDRGFQTIIGDRISDDEREQIFKSLNDCGALVSGRWNELANEGSRHEQLPRIIKFDMVGNPVERVEFGPLTRQLRREVAEFGVLTKARNEIHKFGMMYLLSHNGEASLTCPIACTDGLIRAVEARGSEFLRTSYLARLKSVDIPFGGAQFVTEKAGGSDIGAIEMTAAANDDGSWSLTGDKWFCSNPDEFYAVAARPEEAPSGTEGIALFFVPRSLPDGRVNNLEFLRLKDKLGTQSLPTAEINFTGAIGYPIGDVGEGFKTLMHYVINVSRVHNAVSACGILRRTFIEARNYARQREAFGTVLANYPLVQETLVSLLERLWRYRVLTFSIIELIDRHGINPADRGQAMWQRFLINLAKYRTAANLTQSVHDAIMVLGGNGIVEDFSVLPRLLRDAMIVETWEGAHNTLCLQMVRDAMRSDIVDRWRAEVNRAIEQWPRDFLATTRSRVVQTFRQTLEHLSNGLFEDKYLVQAHARRLVDRLGDLLELAWMSELARRHARTDATAGLLTAIAGYYLLPNFNLFEHPALDGLAHNGRALIDETPLSIDLSRL